MSTPRQHLETIACLWHQFAKQKRPTGTRPNPEYLRLQAAIYAESQAFTVAMRALDVSTPRRP